MLWFNSIDCRGNLLQPSCLNWLGFFFLFAFLVIVVTVFVNDSGCGDDDDDEDVLRLVIFLNISRTTDVTYFAFKFIYD